MVSVPFVAILIRPNNASRKGVVREERACDGKNVESDSRRICGKGCGRGGGGKRFLRDSNSKERRDGLTVFQRFLKRFKRERTTTYSMGT